MKNIRVTTILGTRPELIRLACIIKKFDENFDHRIIHTGQNSSKSLSQVFIEELGIRPIDLHLGITSFSLGEFCAKLFSEIEKELIENRPDAVVILGDTNSALSGIIAKRMGIPVYHLEAGNRSFDVNVPEEINRKIVDHFSDYNLTYTQNARSNLLREGLHPNFITVIGSPLKEVLSRNMDLIDSSKVLCKLNLKPKSYFLVSAHRQENIDSPKRLNLLLKSLNEVAVSFDIPIIVSTHPRMQDRILKANFEVNPNIKFMEPFSFSDYIKLQQNSRVVLSDSGSVSEESAILGFPAITIRDSMERQEALEFGTIAMSGLTSRGMINAINVVESNGLSEVIPNEYLVENTAQRVVNYIISTIFTHDFRSGKRILE